MKESIKKNKLIDEKIFLQKLLENYRIILNDRDIKRKWLFKKYGFTIIFLLLIMIIIIISIKLLPFYVDIYPQLGIFLIVTILIMCFIGKIYHDLSYDINLYIINELKKYGLDIKEEINL